MQVVILFKDDLANPDSDPTSINMSWAALLETLHVETSVLVNGRYVEKKIESIELHVAETYVDSMPRVVDSDV